MSEIWPRDVLDQALRRPEDSVRGFRCLILMPFLPRYDAIAEIIKVTVKEFATSFAQHYHLNEPQIERLDWVLTSGAIQNQIWTKIVEADLVFCDLTGHNPNVMFEAGVCAATKDIEQIVFLRDQTYPVDSPFDIAPFRYLAYSLTSEGVPKLRQAVASKVQDALVRFPDSQSDEPRPERSVSVDFSTNADDSRLYTPPFAHRRVKNGRLEFGSAWVFPHSWATVGPRQIDHFDLKFEAAFAGPVIPDRGYIGVGVRSHHYYANFAHIVYLNRDGSIVLTEPNEEAPNFYRDVLLRPPEILDHEQPHSFHLRWTAEKFSIKIDNFRSARAVRSMPKVLQPGAIRLQTHKCWMALANLRLNVLD